MQGKSAGAWIKWLQLPRTVAAQPTSCQRPTLALALNNWSSHDPSVSFQLPRRDQQQNHQLLHRRFFSSCSSFLIAAAFTSLPRKPSVDNQSRNETRHSSLVTSSSFLEYQLLGWVCVFTRSTNPQFSSVHSLVSRTTPTFTLPTDLPPTLHPTPIPTPTGFYEQLEPPDPPPRPNPRTPPRGMAAPP